MTETTISLRIQKSLHEQMKMHEDINWSAVLRKSIAEQLEKIEKIDFGRAKAASEKIDKLRKSAAFSLKLPSEDIIRKWRDKRMLTS